MWGGGVGGGRSEGVCVYMNGTVLAWEHLHFGSRTCMDRFCMVRSGSSDGARVFVHSNRNQ